MVIAALTVDSPAEHPGTILTITLPKLPIEPDAAYHHDPRLLGDDGYRADFAEDVNAPVEGAAQRRWLAVEVLTERVRRTCVPYVRGHELMAAAGAAPQRGALSAMHRSCHATIPGGAHVRRRRSRRAGPGHARQHRDRTAAVTGWAGPVDACDRGPAGQRARDRHVGPGGARARQGNRQPGPAAGQIRAPGVL
jgi:hypothetical protein